MKIQYKMAYDRNPLLTIYADKCKVREFVANKVGSDYLTESYGILKNPKEVSELTLPKNFVIKANHGSGASVIVWEGVENSDKIRIENGNNWKKYLINPKDLSWDTLIPLMEKWLKQSYWWDIGRAPEWAYKNIEPRILIEELLLDENDQLPKDYKFFMFNGECELIQVDSQRFQDHSRDLFDVNWNLLPVQIHYPNSLEQTSKPKSLNDMLNIAKTLSEGIDFIRVDLYETNKGVRFGELTNYPGAGREIITPDEWNYTIGKNWNPKYTI